MHSLKYGFLIKNSFHNQKLKKERKYFKQNIIQPNIYFNRKKKPDDYKKFIHSFC